MSLVETDVRSMSLMLDTSLQQQLIQGVLSCTSGAVHEALLGNWGKVLDLVEQRRRFMESLLAATGAGSNGSITALQAAVAESEQAITRVVAHAIASSRWPGAMFALRH